MNPRLALAFLVLLASSGPLARTAGADEHTFARIEDVIYGRKFGTALTLDVLKPKQGANGAAVVMVISGGFRSSHESINPGTARPMLDRGYTVFAVVHGSQPRYTVPEIVQDMHRAVRFIRHHAADYAIDPERIGITGASAGGHLSLMIGTAGEKGNPSAPDPVDRESSRVKAVACFFPPTDLLNFGKTGHQMLRAMDHNAPYRPAFDYRERDPASNLWVTITDPERLRKIAREISPIDHVTPDDPPTMIIHGDADSLVPIQQSETMVEKLKGAGVEAKLVVKKGAGHGWLTIGLDVVQFVDWFDQHLKKADAPAAEKEKPCACEVVEDAAALPDPWTDRDIGETAVAGKASFAGDAFTITGTLDIWGKADGFHYVYRPLEGDGEVQARVNAVENTNEHAKAGVMIRESLDPGARHATMVATPVDGTQFLRRKDAGNVTTNTNPGRNRGKFPCWVKLVRKGDDFSAYESSDGQEWVLAGRDTVKLGPKAYVGLVASSHQKTVTSTSRLDRVSVAP